MNSAVKSHPWSEEALFGKARLYIEQMELFTADDWQLGLWSALSLELLARASLAHISPVLLADKDNWRNLMHALGADPTEKKFTPSSLSFAEVLNRLLELLPEFTGEMAKFCAIHSGRRNAELHSGELTFASVGTSEWLPSFYESCKVLLESMGKQLSSFVSNPESAEDMIASLKDAAAKAVQGDIKAHRQVWSNMDKGDQEIARAQAEARATPQTGHRVACPACSSPALVQGDAAGTVTTNIKDGDVVKRQTMVPSIFACLACGLRVSGLSKLSACGLGNAFTWTSTYSAAEFFELYTEEDLEHALNEIMNSEDYYNE